MKKLITITLFIISFASISVWAGTKLSSITAKAEAGSNSLTFEFAGTVKKGPVSAGSKVSLSAAEKNAIANKQGKIIVSDGQISIECGRSGLNSGGEVYNFSQYKTFDVTASITGSPWSYSSHCNVSGNG